MSILSGQGPEHKLVTAAVFLLLGISQHAHSAVVNIHTTFADDPRAEVFVSWRGTSSELVEYGTSTSYGLTTTASSFLSGGGTQHHAKLTGLNSGTRYYFQCGGEPTGTGSFTTSPDGPAEFTFAVPGDIQTSARWATCATWIRANYPDLAMVCNVGDETSLGLNQGDWNHLFTRGGGLMRNAPFMPLIGNHELRRTHGGTNEWPTLYLDQFRLPDNGDSVYNGCWYAFEYADALFIGLLYPFAPLNVGTREAQTVWMEQLLSTTTKKWKFVFLHHENYCSKRDIIIEDGNPVWTDMWERYEVNAVFNGHSHMFERTVPINADTAVASFAEGTLYYNSGGVTNSPSSQTSSIWFRAAVADTVSQALIGMVHVTLDSATVTTYEYPAGTVYDKLTLPARGQVPVQVRTPSRSSDAPHRNSSTAPMLDLRGRFVRASSAGEGISASLYHDGNGCVVLLNQTGRVMVRQ